MKRAILAAVAAALLSAGAGAGAASADVPYAFQWARQFGTNEVDIAYGVAVDPAGNALLAGTGAKGLFGPPDLFNDGFLAKYDSAGHLLWGRAIASSGFDTVYAVASDSTGNALVTGWSDGSLGGPNVGSADVFVLKYDGSGNLLWSRQFGTAASDYGYGVAADAAGNAFITGYTINGALGGPIIGWEDAFLVKYNSAGQLLWARQAGTAGDDRSESVATDDWGNAFVAGYTNGSLAGPNAGGYDAFLMKYDPDGELLWSRQFGSSMNDFGLGVAADAAGNAYMVGWTAGMLIPGSPGYFDAFLAKYDPAGNPMWLRQLGTGTDDSAWSVAVDPAGNVLVTGRTYGSLGGPNAGSGDGFLASFSDSGDLMWLTQFGTASLDFAYSLAISDQGVAFISGYTQGSLGGPNAGFRDAFLVNYIVPEPGTLALLGTGGIWVLGCGAGVRRRRQECKTCQAAADRPLIESFPGGKGIAPR